MEKSPYNHEGDDVVSGELTPSPVLSKEKEALGEKDARAYSNELPHYHDEEGRDDGGIHLDTAEDIVTTIIHTDDDPTLNPWTFRTFFIGKLDSSASPTHIDCIQDWDYLALDLCYPRSITSSLRLSMYQSVWAPLLSQLHSTNNSLVFLTLIAYVGSIVRKRDSAGLIIIGCRRIDGLWNSEMGTCWPLPQSWTFQQ